MGSTTAGSTSGLNLAIALLLMLGGASMLLGAAFAERDRRRRGSDMSPYWATMWAASGLGAVIYGFTTLSDTGPSLLSASGVALIFVGAVGMAVVAFRQRRRQTGG